MNLDEKRKWDDYYRSGVPTNPPEVAALGQELKAWFETILPPGRRKVLEAGCGSGAQSLALAKDSSFDVHLLDMSAEALAVARALFAEHQAQAHFHSGDLFEAGAPDFDLVFNSGVIEHYSFEDQVRMVSSMARRSKGMIAILAPNSQCYWYWISRVRSSAQGGWPFGKEMPVSSLRDVFQAAGLTLVEEKYLGRAWAGRFFAELPEIAPGLKELLLQCHSSPLIGDRQACYLYGAIGSPDPSAVARNLRPGWFIEDSLRAMAADSLAMRVSAEAEIAELNRRISAQQESHALLRQQANLVGEAEAKACRERDQARRSLADLRAERDALLTQNAGLAERATRDAAAVQSRDTELQAARGRESETARRLAALEIDLRESRSLAGSLANGISSYEASLESALSGYRNQRAWRSMIAIRKAYDLWTRQGWTGKLRAIPLLLRAPFAPSHSHPDQEIQLPSIRAFVPALQSFQRLAPGHLASPAAPSLPVPLQRKYDVVILAIVDFDFRFQRPQQIAARFAKNGHRVFWISPTRFAPSGHRDPYQLLPLRENLWEIRLRGPQPDIYMGELRPDSKAAFEDGLRRMYRDLAISESAVLAQLPFWRALALSLRREHGAVLVYDCMDEWDSFENIGEFNRDEERSLVHECDVLVVTAQRLAEKFTARGLSPVLVRNGVDYNLFANAPAKALLSRLPKPIVGYFGAIADWIDLDLVYEAARRRPHYSFVLIGQVFSRDTSALEALPNVHLLGNQPYESIPSFLREFDACTIPFLLNDVTAATDPVKLYEYLSLGKPVVATDLAEIRPYSDLLYIAKDVEQFCGGLDRGLAEEGEELRTRRIEFARRNTWDSRVAAIDLAVREKFPLVSIVIVTHNSARYAGPCLRSILRNDSYPNYEVILVDNASTDGTREVLRSYSESNPRFHCELLDENRGFAAGNNIGARRAEGAYLVLLNPDTIVTPGWLGRLVSHLHRDPSIGLLCPATNFAGNEAKIPTGYHDETSMETFSSFLSTQCLRVFTELSMVPLYCGIVSRELYKELQGLDERYGVGMFEDDDLSAAVRARGLRVGVAEDAFVHHFGQGAFSKLAPEQYNLLFEENRKRFERKWNVRWQPHRLRAGVIPPHEDVRFHPEDF